MSESIRKDELCFFKSTLHAQGIRYCHPKIVRLLICRYISPKYAQTTDKLAVFDDFWNKVNETWGGFPNLTVNWDSLKNVYRPLVASGVSRGRFCGILSGLARDLSEWHVWMKDSGLDSLVGFDFGDSGEARILTLPIRTSPYTYTCWRIGKLMKLKRRRSGRLFGFKGSSNTISPQFPF